MQVTSNVAYDLSGSMNLDMAGMPEKLDLRYSISANQGDEKQCSVESQDISSGLSSEYLPIELKNKIVPFHSKPAQDQDSFAVIQKWEGYVSSVTEDTFEATLCCIKGEGPDQYAKFSFEDVSDDDRPLISVGAVFYWSIGYLEKISGQRLRASLIRFRRLPAWTRRELANAEARAKELESLFDAE